MILKKPLLFSIILLVHFAISAQTTIKGTVKDFKTGKNLSGASIVINNTNLGTSTDDNGEYILENIADNNLEIVVSFVGYKTVAKKVVLSKSINVYNFALTPQTLIGDEVVVVATKTKKQIKNIPSRVELVAIKEMTAYSAQNVDGFLSNTVGVNVNRNLGIFSHKSIVSMRGIGGDEQSRVLILLDGVPMNKTDGGSVNWNIFNSNEVDRIEILKGPGSSLYGSNAMGGVVNIITKKSSKKLSGLYSAEYGTFNTFSNKINLSGNLIKNNKGFYGAINGFYRKSDGYVMFPEEDIDSTTIKSNLKEYLASAKAGYKFNNLNSLEYKFDYFNDFRGKGVKIKTDEGTYFGHNSMYHKLHYKGGFGNTKLSTLVYYNNEDYLRLNESIKIKNGVERYKCYSVNSKREDLGLLFNISQNIGKSHVVTAGFDIKQGKVTGKDIYQTSTDIVNNEGTMDIYAAYIQDEMRYLDNKLMINVGLRFDYANFRDGKFYITDKTNATSILTELENDDFNSNTWSSYSPKLSAKYIVNNYISIFTSLAKGFKPPDLDDLSRSGFIAGAFKKANPQLNPETLNNIEVGFDADAQKMHFTASAYYSQGLNFMYYVSTGDSIDMGHRTLPIRKKENIGKVIIKGVELSFRYPILENLDFYTNYTFTDSKIDEFISPHNDADLSDKYLRYIPKHQTSAGVSWMNNIVNLSVQYRYKSNQFRDDLNKTVFDAYSMIDCKIWRDFSKHITASINAQNITDVVFIDDHNYLSPGRFITASVLVKF